MHQPYRRAILVGLSIVLVALLFATSVGPAQSMRGVAGPTLAMSASPFLATISIGAAFAMSIVVAGIAGRLVNAVVGLFILGCGVGLLAMRSGTVLDVVFGGASLRGLAVEGFLWTILVAAAAFIVFRISGPLPDAIEVDDPRVDGPLGTKALVAQVAGVIAPLCVWLMASSPAKGQAIGAVVVGSMLVGLVGRLLAPKSPPILLFAAPIAFGSIGYLVASMTVGAVPLDLAFVNGALSRLAYPMPIDYAAGSLAGVALGVGWSRSFLKPVPAAAA